MNEFEITSMIAEYIAAETDADVRTFERAGVMTNNAGIVVTIDDQEFQITVVQSR